ncbi:PQQ-binding-like beta-propeller repeat protein, partial [Natronococcus sp.]|uniref:outer membrane protein assembly factor BamB family protein n=1 Tax=Natronococcus sp. TaxID=35747 RepID=UPI003A4D9C69
MNDWRRRSVLATVAAIPAGALASVAVADSSPQLEADWPSHRGSAGHARVVEDGHEFDGDALEAVWSAAHDGHVAVADGIVYTTTADAVVALDAADGALVWKNAHVEANTPSVDDERVFLTGTEVVALDRTDGTFRWRSDFGTDEAAAWQTVADDTVYVVINGSLYALEPDDGSLRWDVDLARASGSDVGDAFFPETAAADGMVYAATDGAVLAYDSETGDEIWRNDAAPGRDVTLHATAAAVAVTGSGEPGGRLYDPETGVVIDTIDAESPRELALGSELYVARTDRAYRGRSIGDAEIDWTVDVPDAAGPPVIAGDTVYVYGAVVSGDDRRLTALDDRNGTEKWSIAEGDVR